MADDRSWLTQALAEHRPALLRYAASIVGQSHANDIVQEVALRAMREPGPVTRAWWFTTCRCRAIDLLRKDGRMTTLVEPFQQPHAAPTPADALETRDTHDAVLRAMHALPVQQREVLRLKFQAGLSYKEIAQTLDLTPGHVGYLIHHGLKALRARLAD